MRSGVCCSVTWFCLSAAALLPWGVALAQVSPAGVEVGAVSAPPASWSSSVSADDAVLPPGITLPRLGMVHAIDQEGDGPALVQLHATEIVTDSHAVGNFLRRQVLAGYSGAVELKGPNATVHLQTTTPSFLVRLNGDDPELMRERIHLLRLQPTENGRVVLTYSGNSFGGQHRKKMDEVVVTKVDVEPQVWVRVTPTEPLAAGEYGLVVMPTDVREGPDAVYDFDVAFLATKPDTK